MGTLFRSEEMTLCQLFIQNEVAYSCVSELGELGLVQFRDLNPDVNAFQRKYVSEIRRCDDLQRKLRYLEKEIKEANIPILDLGDNPDAPSPPEMIEMETNIEKCEEDLKEINRNYNQLRKNRLELTEMKFVLRKAQNFFEETPEEHDFFSDNQETMDDAEVGLLSDDHTIDYKSKRALGFFAGVISRERMPGFERLLWRACRGTAFLRSAEIEVELEDPSTGGSIHKSVVLIFFQGDQLKSRISKICDSFHVNRFPCPDTEEARREAAIGVMTRLQDLNLVLNQTREHRHRVLQASAQNLKVWSLKTSKIKAIYHTLNMFNLDVTNKCLIGECWCSVDDLEKIQAALICGTERVGGTVQPILNRMHTSQAPPTFNRVNKFTKVFQNIVDAYGVARYQEANPAPFSAITFPFLFAVMFGDCGHGILMFLAALWMVLSEQKIQKQRSDNEVWNTFFGGRYIILLMGAFSVYTGLIYNDCYSLSLNIFGSSWHPEYSAATLQTTKKLQLDPTPFNNTHDGMYSGNPYPFGLDPAWQAASNKITFTNSIKMKMSVILGVSQMIFGVFLSCTNHVFFKDWLSLWCEFIPQIIFISAIFLYLIILIFWKWIMYSAATSSKAPSLLIGLINMFMFKHPASGAIYNGQAYVEDKLVVLAVICVPWMLLVKPLILRHRNQVKHAQYERLENLTSTDHVEDVSTEERERLEHEINAFSFADTFVHQAIHTIEYCLGCISNTASYLRLWALSLAHAQLSEVLWSMIFRMGLHTKGLYGSVILFLIFAAWAVLTLGILLLMEGLSAFLHALRLHWVEFQNKFYQGTGYLFVPFYLDPMLLELPEE